MDCGTCSGACVMRWSPCSDPGGCWGVDDCSGTGFCWKIDIFGCADDSGFPETYCCRCTPPGAAGTFEGEILVVACQHNPSPPSY